MNGSEFILVLVVVAFGAAIGLFGLLTLMYRAIVGVGRGVARGLGWRGPGGSSEAGGEGFRRLRGGRACPNPKCGRIEYRRAADCSHCGRSMDAGARR